MTVSLWRMTRCVVSGVIPRKCVGFRAEIGSSRNAPAPHPSRDMDRNTAHDIVPRRCLLLFHAVPRMEQGIAPREAHAGRRHVAFREMLTADPVIVGLDGRVLPGSERRGPVTFPAYQKVGGPFRSSRLMPIRQARLEPPALSAAGRERMIHGGSAAGEDKRIGSFETLR